MSKIDIGISESDRNAVAEGLKKLLADSYTLYLQTHNFHWNVEGPQFRELHLMFEEHYTELAEAVDEIAERRVLHSLADLEAMARRQEDPRGFANAIAAALITGKAAVVAEVKKASPSKGLIRTDFVVPLLANDYEKGGASCLSVLTDRVYFQGEDSYLTAARNAVKLPVLRKDFILDPYQVIESRAIGADCVLLIMAAIIDTQADELSACTRELGMDLLIEIHDEFELERALKLHPALLGINNRNLKTLEVDLTTTERLAPQVPTEWTIVCESGIYTSHHISRMKEIGVNRFLVGESLMRQSNVVSATRDLLGLPS